MTSLRTIIRRTDELRRQGVRGVLATVVRTEGSSYRRTGARMLIEKDGTLTGFLSAGCLESDLVQRTKRVVREGLPELVVYDTSAPEDIVWGLGLGCNGTLTILLEPTDSPSVAHTTTFLARRLLDRSPGAMALAIGSPEAPDTAPGFVCSYPLLDPSASGPPALMEDLKRAALSGRQFSGRYSLPTGTADLSIEPFRPPPAITIYGAGPDVPFVCLLATELEWDVSVVDKRSEDSLRKAVPNAHRVLSAEPQRLADPGILPPGTAVLVMSHNYLVDKEALRVLLPRELLYVGLLGPKRRKDQILGELAQEGLQFTEAQTEKLHAPIGLDIGAGSPEEIALSIVAELQAVFTGRTGGFLKLRDAPIHGR